MLELIKTRRSTRKFLDKMIPAELLDQVLEAGRYAPSGGNNQTNHFIVIKNKAVLERLCGLVVDCFCGMEVTPGMYRSMANSINRSKAGGYVFTYGAPVLIIMANKKGYGNNMADSSVAIENMMLMANALDLGSCWINQLKWIQEDAVIAAELKSYGLEEDEVVCGGVAIGYPDTEDGLPVRTPLVRIGNKVTVIE